MTTSTLMIEAPCYSEKCFLYLIPGLSPKNREKAMSVMRAKTIPMTRAVTTVRMVRIVRMGTIAMMVIMSRMVIRSRTVTIARTANVQNSYNGYDNLSCYNGHNKFFALRLIGKGLILLEDFFGCQHQNKDNLGNAFPHPRQCRHTVCRKLT